MHVWVRVDTRVHVTDHILPLIVFQLSGVTWLHPLYTVQRLFPVYGPKTVPSGMTSFPRLGEQYGGGKTYTGRGGHCTYFVDRGTIGVGTTHNIQRKNLYGRVGGWVDGWVDDSYRKYSHFVAPSCKMELDRFSALLRIQDGAERGNIKLDCTNWVHQLRVLYHQNWTSIGWKSHLASCIISGRLAGG